MENNLEILENIMKPYFDKKKEIENVPVELQKEKDEAANKLREMKNERLGKRKELEAELKNLRTRKETAINDYKEKMEREIEEYINRARAHNPNISPAYISFIRKDLQRGFSEDGQTRMGYDQRLKEIEDNFKAQEETLVAEIAKLKSVPEEEKTSKQDLDYLNKKSSFERVDLRELVEIKEKLRKSLFAEQKRLNFELKQQQIVFDAIMLKLGAFKYEYNDQQQVINGAEWRAIYEESNKVADKIDALRKALKKVEEYIKLTDLTKEETAAVMMSMTPWEKAEYNRRKAAATTSTAPEEETPVKNEDLVEIEDPVVSEFEEKDGNIVVDDMSNLLKTIYNEIVKEAMKLNSVKLNESKSKEGLYISSKSGDEEYKENGMVDESIKLPCGEYLNNDDINQAIDNLYNKTKDRKYIVKATGKEFKISKLTVEKLKHKLKKCSTIKLVKEKKVSKLDLLKVFGKKKANKVMNEVEMSTLKDVNVKEGDYINRNELIANLDNLFTTKKLEWLKSLSSSLKDKKNSVVNYFKNKRFDEEMNLEETRVIKK